MAIWRSHDLEQLIGGPLDEGGLTADAVRRLIERKVAEGEQLDYKTDTSSVQPTADKTGPDKARLNEFAKDVAAFANGRGGLLLYGVKETDKVPDEVVGLPSMSLDSMESAMRSKLVQYVSPVPDIAVISILFDNAAPCLAVVVPPSDWAPHGVSYATRGQERRPLDHPVRAGAHTRWMTEPEIASRYQERGRTAQNRAARIERLITEAKVRLAASESVWVYLSVVPEHPVAAAMTASFVRTAADWLPEVRANSPLHGSLLTLPQEQVAPDRLILTDFGPRDTPTWMSDVYIELHTDGSAFVAVDGLHRAESGRKNQRQLDLLELVDALILAAQIAPRWSRDQAGANGGATLTSGIACQMHGVLEAQFDLHHSLGGGYHQRIASARGMMQHDPQMTAPIDIVESMGPRDALLIARQAASGILQWFGLVEPAQISAAGDLAVDAWNGGPGFGNAQQAQQWQQLHLPPNLPT